MEAEVILNNFDPPLTGLEVDLAVERWHESVGFIPEDYFDSAPAGFGEAHILSKLQQIAIDVVRERPYKE